MSNNLPYDILDMHEKYGVYDKVKTFDKEKLKSFFEFRVSFLEEELAELKEAKTADDAVDALIDLCVVAIGTLDLFDVDVNLAWNRVHSANMSKEVGIKASRPNKLGLPDLIKPLGWQAPTHADNVGLLGTLFDENA
jgi:hypothetical protein